MTSMISSLLKVFGRQGRSWLSNCIGHQQVNSFARDPVDSIAVSSLPEREQMPVSELAEHLAEKLYRDELRHGGWAVDLGLLGPNVFVAEALQALRVCNGDVRKIDGSDVDP
jgi:hypothetical protein